jgi:hypothetical protein
MGQSQGALSICCKLVHHAVLLVEHDMDAVFAVACCRRDQRLTVLVRRADHRAQAVGAPAPTKCN